MKKQKIGLKQEKSIFKALTFLFFFSSLFLCFAQATYFTTTSVNLRNAPNVKSNIVVTLPKNLEVSLVEKTNSEWYLITVQGYNGYVATRYITLKADPYADWEKKNLISGETPECENINPKFDYNLDNYLEVNVGSNTDVVVKLMKMNSIGDECFRMVYVRGGDSHRIKNVPEGKYYLKIAYGRDFRKKKNGDQCEVKFVKNAEYEKGTDILDFNLIKENGLVEIPSFELFLDVQTSNSLNNNYDSKNISEKEFNN
jgi:hypothetical protein